MKVWAIFSVFGDGDGYAQYDLLGVGATVDAAKLILDDYELLRRMPFPRTLKPVHPSMSADNRFTFVGTREECSTDCAYHGGFVIEPIDVRGS